MHEKDETNLLGTLEEESIKRKKKIENLRNKRKFNEDQTCEEKNKNVLPKPIFRSYIPSNDSLKESKLPKGEPEPIESQIQDQLKAIKKNNLVEEVDLFNLAPKKIDWDLKRNIENDLKKLDKRTEKAIADLIRDRIKNEQ